jgi:hypothetical protein
MSHIFNLQDDVMSSVIGAIEPSPAKPGLSTSCWRTA